MNSRTPLDRMTARRRNCVKCIRTRQENLGPLDRQHYNRRLDDPA
jgi:hypothetical protein